MKTVFDTTLNKNTILLDPSEVIFVQLPDRIQIVPATDAPRFVDIESQRQDLVNGATVTTTYLANGDIVISDAGGSRTIPKNPPAQNEENTETNPDEFPNNPSALRPIAEDPSAKPPSTSPQGGLENEPPATTQ